MMYEQVLLPVPLSLPSLGLDCAMLSEYFCLFTYRRCPCSQGRGALLSKAELHLQFATLRESLVSEAQDLCLDLNCDILMLIDKRILF